jgi:hypothetical protein
MPVTFILNQHSGKNDSRFAACNSNPPAYAPTGNPQRNLMAKMQSKNLTKPDELRTFANGKVELVTLGGVTFGRATLQPGWKWSTCVKPIVKTKSCEAPHLQYHVSGRLHVLMDDGSAQEFGPGEVSLLPPGHDAWVVGNEPVVVIDISGMVEYGKPHEH